MLRSYCSSEFSTIRKVGANDSEHSKLIWEAEIRSFLISIGGKERSLKWREKVILKNPKFLRFLPTVCKALEKILERKGTSKQKVE